MVARRIPARQSVRRFIAEPSRAGHGKQFCIWSDGRKSGRMQWLGEIQMGFTPAFMPLRLLTGGNPVPRRHNQHLDFQCSPIFYAA